MIPVSFLDELRSRLPLSGIVGRRVRLTRRGHEHLGLCPFHHEKTPSFTVVETKGFYHCHGCGAHGDVIGFEMRAGGMSFRDAVERLADEAGLQVPKPTAEDEAAARRTATLREVIEAAAVFFERELRMPAGRPALDYLRGRGLDDDIIGRFRLGYAPPGGALAAALRRAGLDDESLIGAGLVVQPDDGRSAYDTFRDRVMFPITDRRGRVIAFGGRVMGDGQPKYLNSPDTDLFHKGSVLYGLSQAREPIGKAGRAIVVEGYLDVIALHQAGYGETVAPLGTAIHEQQLADLWRLAPEVILCLDGDAAGGRAAERVAERVFPGLRPGWALRVATLPDGADPDSLVRGGGREALDGPKWEIPTSVRPSDGRAALDAVLAAARPLADVAWDLAMRRYPPDIPERVAALELSLYRRAAAIEDATVRRAYMAEWRRRLRELGPPDPTVVVGRAKKAAPKPGGGRLRAEWDSARTAAEAGPVRPWLERMGVPWDWLVARIGGVGFVRGRLIKGRWAAGEQWGNAVPPSLWEPSEAGESLVLLPEWDDGPEDGVLWDLVAWNPRTGALATRAGAAAVLGAAVVEDARASESAGLPRRVQVAADPLSWLRRTAAGDDAVLVVDWRRAWDSLGGLSALVAETVDLGERLDRAVRPPRLARPEIFVGELGAAAGAAA